MWDEPFGLVVLEALACGTPVAAFDRGAVRELTTPDVAALAEAGDVAALAAAIRTAAGLDRWDCRAHAEAIGSTDTMLDGYTALYEELAR